MHNARMKKPGPRQIFDTPQAHVSFLTVTSDDQFEGQHFDRKEVARAAAGESIAKNALDATREHVIKTVSAFANSNVEGGLLVLGVSKTGGVVGIDHLGENQTNSLTGLNTLLRAHAAEVKHFQCPDASGSARTICLIYSGWVSNAICETTEAASRAWVRSGPQSLPITQAVRDQLRRSKGLFNQDTAPCCPFAIEDVDQEVLGEFRRVFHPETTRQFSDERLLREAGAIVSERGQTHFTLPGLLFFASNPQRIVAHAYLRLLKFVVPSAQHNSRGTPSFDKDFKGPVTKQLRAARTFLRETSFFERLQHRKPEGGFTEEPELPPIAVDEAIVNAVAHRDYYTSNPIYCEHYQDALVVKNPGRIRQQNIDLPNRFDLESTPLDSMPLNRQLLEWLRAMKDPDGNAFVQALSEGTKRMTREMLTLSLPAPGVVLLANETIVKLESNAPARKAAFLARMQVPKTSFLNLYPLSVSKGNSVADKAEVHLRIGELTKTLRDSLAGHSWYIDRFSFSRIVAHRTGSDLAAPAVHKVIRFYPAYSLQVHELFGRTYLSIDYTCQVLSILRANEVARYLPSEQLVGRIGVAQTDTWRTGKITSSDGELIDVHFFDNEEVTPVPANRVIPNLTLAQIEIILKGQRIAFDLHGTIKKFSLASETAAARKRAEKIQITANQFAAEIFPVIFGEFVARMEPEAVGLSAVESRSDTTFHFEPLSEPVVEFRDRQKLPDVREGITKYGSYDGAEHKIELVPVCLIEQRQDMEGLIQRLKSGKYKYKGAERTFATRLSYSTIVAGINLDGLHREVGRLIAEHPDWCGNERLDRLFLVQTPEAGFATDDEKSPYFVIKRQLLEAGIPCQMVDTPTMRNPDWKDLNLGLNIVAKCGITPWVLPENIPDADFFVGLSYTQSRDGQRILGFANVFNSYGKWEFYAGNTTSFDTAERGKHLGELAHLALMRLQRDHSLPANPNLVFHHSLRISRDDYASILIGVRRVAPDASVTFVWVNAHNNFRLFDSRPETDGSVGRGSFVPISRRRTLLSTTGHNAYRKALGTPRPLEISANRYRSDSKDPVECDARTIAVQVLNLTKLNWASTDSFSAEPITTKYAGDIAYLTAAFLRQREPFKLHKVLERTPWFV
jgi:predicted HTH transcriptional regulator